MTVSPADTSLDSPDPEDDDVDLDGDVDIKEEDDDKKPTKKRKSWGQELPTPKTNLPPRYIALISPRLTSHILNPR